MSFFATPNLASARRLFLGRSGLVLSGPAIALLAGNDALAAHGRRSRPQGRADPQHRRLVPSSKRFAAYQVGAQSNLLQKPALDLALTFQGHQKEHAELLARRSRARRQGAAAKANYDFPVRS